MTTERIALKDGQVWLTRGGDHVLLKYDAARDYFESYNPNCSDKWVYANGDDGLAGPMERQTFLDESTEDLMELVSEP